jgi:hypothetical protein
MKTYSRRQRTLFVFCDALRVMHRFCLVFSLSGVVNAGWKLAGLADRLELDEILPAYRNQGRV